MKTYLLHDGKYVSQRWKTFLFARWKIFLYTVKIISTWQKSFFYMNNFFFYKMKNNFLKRWKHFSLHDKNSFLRIENIFYTMINIYLHDNFFIYMMKNIFVYDRKYFSTQWEPFLFMKNIISVWRNILSYTMKKFCST